MCQYIYDGVNEKYYLPLPGDLQDFFLGRSFRYSRALWKRAAAKNVILCSMESEAIEESIRLNALLSGECRRSRILVIEIILLFY